jgi:hypothetical protein
MKKPMPVFIVKNSLKALYAGLSFPHQKIFFPAAAFLHGG